MEPIHLTVIGEPQPGGSKRAFIHLHTKRVVVTDANPRARDWKWVVAGVALDAREPGAPLLDGPLRSEIYVYRPRPRSHFKKDGTLRSTAPAYPTTRPDTGKISRPIHDALTSVLYTDDARIVDDCVYKRYGEPARAEITIRPMTADDDDDTDEGRGESMQLALVA
jgi:Holliday junction resolvase RusA-like endonuclease